MPKGVYDHWKIRGRQGFLHPWLAGELNPMKRPEIRAKIAGDKNPMKRSEVRAKVSAKLKGMSHPWQLGDKNPAKRLEVRTKISAKLKGRKLTEAWKRKISISHTGIPSSKKGIKDSSISERVRQQWKEHREKMCKAVKEGHVKKWQDEEWAKKQRKLVSDRMKIATTLNWRNKEYREKQTKAILKGLFRRPTKPEQKLINLIQQYNLPFDYIGDGKIVINGFCPDFIDNDGSKRIIEVFGDYWHRNDSEEERKEVFAKYGFKTLIIWEHELKEPEKVAEKINGFIKEGGDFH